MKFKTVMGITGPEVAQRAFNVAMAHGLPPHHVDTWRKWFDAQPADQGRQCDGVDCDRDCTNWVPFGVTACDTCASLTQPAPDVPEPEYYVGDLEEVAYASAKLAIESAVKAVRGAHPMQISTVGDIVRLITGELDRVSAEISCPGYVENLLP